MKKVLIPEDNDINFMLFVEILKDMDIELVQVRNGVEAIEYCKLNPDVSLILMDINMPIMNGEEAAVIIKQMYPDIPIISQTAYGVYGTVSEENKCCFKCFIKKPINIHELKKVINDILFI